MSAAKMREDVYKLGISDPRIIALALTIILVVSIYLPVTMSLPVSNYMQAFWNEISGLNAGDIVLCDAKIISSEITEVGSSCALLIKYMHERNYKVVFYVTEPDALPLAAQYIEAEYGGLSGTAGYGETYVYLGAIPGSIAQGAPVSAELAFCQNLKIMATDYAGTPLNDLPLMSDLDTLADTRIKLVLTLVSRGLGTHVTTYVTSFNKRYIAEMNSAEQSSYIATFMSGQLHGLMGGNRGGAEFEALSGLKGTNMSVMFAISMGALFLVISMALRNIDFQRKKGRKVT